MFGGASRERGHLPRLFGCVYLVTAACALSVSLVLMVLMNADRTRTLVGNFCRKRRYAALCRLFIVEASALG